MYKMPYASGGIYIGETGLLRENVEIWKYNNNMNHDEDYTLPSLWMTTRKYDVHSELYDGYKSPT